MNKIKEFFRDWSIFEKVWLIFVCSLMTVDMVYSTGIRRSCLS